MKTLRFDHPNDPNAERLIESLRHLGYSNYGAIADIVDNSLDADAHSIKVRIWTEHNQIRLLVADDGIGMDRDTLDQALRLGSRTTKDPFSDLGFFGMGLCTAGLSMARCTRVITLQVDGTFLTSIVDIDEIKKRREFVKYLGDTSTEDKELFTQQLPDAKSGTVVVFDKCDGITNRNTTVFANTLKKHLGRVHRHFLRSGKKLYVNDDPIRSIDPLEIDNPATVTYSDENYPLTFKVDGVERQETVRIRIVLLPERVERGELDLEAGMRHQGFYVLRNMREIEDATTLGAFTKHNDFNRMRGEVFFTGNLDDLVGIDFTKRSLVFDQSLKDQLLQILMPQCTSIKRAEANKTRVKESGDVADLHKKAETYIGQKAKLLMTPKTTVEKRGPKINNSGPVKPGSGEKTRREFTSTQEGTADLCHFDTHSYGLSGPIYEHDTVGRQLLIHWNVDHPFYQRFVLDQRSDGRLVTAVDYLVYSMASAEQLAVNEEHPHLLNKNNFKAIVSSNLLTLLS